MGVQLEETVIKDMIEAGLLNDDCTLSPLGEKVALKAYKRIEKEVKKGLLGRLKWLNFMTAAVLDNIKPEWLNPNT